MSGNPWYYDFFGRMLGLERLQSVVGCRFDFAAAWAHQASLWLLFGCVGLVGLTGYYYFRRNALARQGSRVALFVLRGCVLCLLLLLVAEPVLELSISSRKRPALWLLFDGTDSMNIADELPPGDRDASARAVGLKADAASPGEAAPPPPSRLELLRALVRKKEGNLLEQLEKEFRVQAYLFDSPRSVRSLTLSPDGKTAFDGEHLAGQISAGGKVTALGAAFEDLARRHATASLGSVVVFSDFDQNAGIPAGQAARQLGVPVYTVGLGALQPRDASIEVRSDSLTHKDEKTTVTAVVKQFGLDGQTARVRVFAEPLGAIRGGGGRNMIGEKSVALTGKSIAVEFPYTPHEAGSFNLVAEVDPLPGEAVLENNRSDRQITVLADYLHMLFVEYEPTWEWRFIKEVFYRDRLVGKKGFRTFLYSSDPKVRQQNDTFVPSMTPPAEEFFKNDLIFLGDMPSGPPTPALSDNFCKLVKRFVAMGGGLVILSGPRFGPQNLADTPLADLLPVVVDPAATIRDQEPFMLRLTPDAARYRFMQLGGGSTLAESQEIWNHLGPLPWYQPALRTRPLTDVLAEHPTDTCSDGKEKQPLIAIRPYERGEVVYLAFNETFRLRRLYGEEHFRQFWSQVMERLALNHALGEDKRCVVRTDHDHYQLDDQVTVTVDARDAEYKPLTEDQIVPGHKLVGEVQFQGEGEIQPPPLPLSLTQVKPGQFTAQFAAVAPGTHHIQVIDPVSHKPAKPCTFTVVSTPVERQRADRDAKLQETIAQETGGRSFDLKDVNQLLDVLPHNSRTEISREVVSLVNTWLCFALVAGLLLGEWLLRKWSNLP